MVNVCPWAELSPSWVTLIFGGGSRAMSSLCVSPELSFNLLLFLFLQLNVWKSPSAFGRPVDVLVPSVSLLPVKSFLKSQGLEYSVTIKDLQVGRL